MFIRKINNLLQCRACGSLIRKSDAVIKDRYSTIYSCPNCHLWQVFPLNEHVQYLSSRYKNTDMISYYDTIIVKNWYISRYISLFNHLETLSILPTHNSRNGYLDYGCGFGISLDIATKFGFKNIIGIEKNISLVKHNNMLGRNCMSIMDLNIEFWEHSNFKLCLLDNVLEHIVDPDLILKDIHLSLSDNGVIVIAVPAVDRIRKLFCMNYLFRNYITNPSINFLNDRIEHISFFNKKSMNILLRKCGFTLVDNSYHHNKLYSALNLRNILSTGYYIAVKA